MSFTNKGQEMTHKNWDNVRDNRIYGYLNQAELDLFYEAVHSTGLQRATAVRAFVLAQSRLIVDDTAAADNIPVAKTPYFCPDGDFLLWLVHGVKF